MVINFIGLGLDESANTVGNQLCSSFNDARFHTFTGLSAFVSLAAVTKLAPFIRDAQPRYRLIRFFVGVDENATSREALEALIQNGIDAYVFHTSSLLTFHPKVYLFEGDNANRIIIGSNNLTKSGLFTNIEAALSVDFRARDKAGIKLLRQFKAYFRPIVDLSDPCVAKLDKNLLCKLSDANLLATEQRGTATSEARSKEIEKLFPVRKRSPIREDELGKLDIPMFKNVTSKPFVITQRYMEAWPAYFEVYKKRLQRNPIGIISRKDEDQRLYWWFRTQKQLYKTQQIPLEHREMLESLDFPFEEGQKILARLKWEQRYRELCEYKVKHKLDYVHVPQKRESDYKYKALASWCVWQRVRFKGGNRPLQQYQIDKLNAINFVWVVPKVGSQSFGGRPDDDLWLENLLRLKSYKDKTGDANPSQVDLDPMIRRLGHWVNDQRTLRNTGRRNHSTKLVHLLPVRESLLTELGVDWNYQTNKFKSLFEIQVDRYLEFKKVYPDEMPIKGDRRFKKVLEWKAQMKYKKRKKKLKDWKIKRLDEVGFRW